VNKTEGKKPGISRQKRLSDEGLQRLERQLASGSRLKQNILQQWLKRYGHAAEVIINKYL